MDAYADNPALLMNLLRALSAVAEESGDRAATAARMWPSIVAQVISLHEEGHTPFRDHYYGDYALAALMPRAAGRGHLPLPRARRDPYRLVAAAQLANHGRALASPGTGRPDMRRPSHRLPAAAAAGGPGTRRHPLGSGPRPGQPGRVANRTFLLSTWLIEIRQPASDIGLLSDWQRIVDALVAAGVARLAPYSE